MLNIKVICVGKLKENYLRQAQDEYLKRLSKYSKLEVIELEDEKISKNNLSNTEIENIKKIECDKIISKISKYQSPYIVVLDLKGKQYTSPEFSNLIENVSIYESSTLVFVIGGSLGLNDEVLLKSNVSICFSKLTFPHQLIRIFLLEQIYRGFKIKNNENYHK